MLMKPVKDYVFMVWKKRTNRVRKRPTRLRARGTRRLLLLLLRTRDPREIRRSLGVALRVFGSRHPAVAAETNVLAVFLVEHGRNREAEACYRQSMEIWERTLGPYSPELASGLNNLAILLFMEDRPGWVFARPFK